MRFTTAWAKVASQNVSLKFALLVTSLLACVFGVLATQLSLKPPLILERSCFTRLADPASEKHTTEEIEGFLKEAIPERFDSDKIIKPGFLSIDEQKFKAQEQEELKRRDMHQKVIFISVTKLEGKFVTVDTDRLISVGKIRSAFSFPLIVTLSQTTRNEANPYGLVVEKMTTISQGADHVQPTVVKEAQEKGR